MQILLKFLYYNKKYLSKYIINFYKNFFIIMFRFFYFFFWIISFLSLISNVSFNKKTYRVKIFYLVSLLFFRFLNFSFWNYFGSVFLLHRFLYKYFAFFFIIKMKTKCIKYVFWFPSFSLKIPFLFYLPTKSSLYSILRSPFIYKKSFEQFGIFWYSTYFAISYNGPFFFFIQQTLKTLLSTFLQRPVIKVKLTYNKIYSWSIV